MKSSNLKISKKCIQCGSCLGLNLDFLKSGTDGSIIVKDGTLISTESQEYKNLIEICPVNAFEIDKTINEKDKIQIIIDL